MHQVARSGHSRRRRDVLLDHLDHLLQVVVWVLMVEQAVGQFLQRLKEAIEVHLIIVAAANNVLVNYVIMRLQNVVIRQARVLRQALELRGSYEIVALLPSQNLKHLLGVRVQVQLVQLPVLYG